MMFPFQDIKHGRFYLGDCLEVMKEIPDGCIEQLEEYYDKAEIGRASCRERVFRAV